MLAIDALPEGLTGEILEPGVIHTMGRPGERMVVPDVSGWRLESEAPVPPAFVYANPIVALPTWCCELSSGSTERIDREIKVPLYARAGVEWIWLVDPEQQQIEILHTRGGSADPIEIVRGAVRRALPPFTSVLDTNGWWLPHAP